MRTRNKLKRTEQLLRIYYCQVDVTCPGGHTRRQMMSSAGIFLAVPCPTCGKCGETVTYNYRPKQRVA